MTPSDLKARITAAQIPPRLVIGFDAQNAMAAAAGRVLLSRAEAQSLVEQLERQLPAKPAEFIWTGDLDDDCHCLWGGMTAHAEHMGRNEWYCSVSISVMKDGRPWAGEQLFNTADDDVRPLTGPAARRLCELVMERHFYRQSAQDLIDAMELMGRRFEEQAKETLRLRAALKEVSSLHLSAIENDEAYWSAYLEQIGRASEKALRAENSELRKTKETT